MVLLKCYCTTFSKIQRINAEHFTSSSGDLKLHHTKGVHPIIYLIITNKLATYKELKYDLDIDDMIALYEIAMVSLYNKQIIIDNTITNKK